MRAMTHEKDYVLGTHDEEIERLGLQHRVWRPRTTDAWQRAGFTVGQTLLDIGCGPGYATLDLADIVGPSGRVVAIDRSRRFLDHLESERVRRGLRHVETVEMDLDDARLPERLPMTADGAWGRWVFAFVQDPRALLERVAAALKPGGRLVIYEYFDYSTWKLAPRSAAHELFVRKVVETWRATGGETEIGLSIPAWLHDIGFTLNSTRSLIDIIGPEHYIWQWPKAFIDVGVDRMLELGALTPEQADAARSAVSSAEATPGSLMITPGVMEIIATKH
jgi:SAM-dependent methyltransferase